MTNMMISAEIEAAYQDYCSTSFHNMSPKMIADMMRGGICKIIRAIDGIEDSIRANAPTVHGRSTQSKIENVDRLRNRAQAVWAHMNAEIEKAVARAS